MIHPSHGVNIYIATEAVDFRKGYDGLAALGYRPPAPKAIVPMDKRPIMH